MREEMKVYQLTNVDGEHIGLFQSDNPNIGQVIEDVQKAIEEADGDSEIYNEILEEKNIFPIWAEEIITDVI